MDWVIYFLFFTAVEAETALKRTSRSFANGNIIIKNTSNDIIRVALELWV